MLHFALWLVALCAPDPILHGLDSRDFRTRERASKELTRRMTWPLAVRLTRTKFADPEVRYQVRRALDAYWRVSPEDGWPRLDLKPDGNFYVMDPEWVCNYVWAVTRWTRTTGIYPSPGYYQAAMALWIQDLRTNLVPPVIIRAALHEFERRQAMRLDRRPMPQSPDAPVVARP